MCLFVGSNGSVENQHDIEIPDSVALYDKPLDCAFIRSAEKESERLTDFVYRQTVFFYLVATLFEAMDVKSLARLNFGGRLAIWSKNRL